MILDYEPLLQTQRDLYRIPRGFERFRAYLRVMIEPSGNDIALPLVAMNPMGKEHVAEYLDRLIELDADSVAAEAVAETARLVADEEGIFRCALVLCDDRGGGWTNRFACEHGMRFPARSIRSPNLRKWIVGYLWTNDVPSVGSVRDAVNCAILRLAYLQRHGPARTLRQKLAQEGEVMARAGCTQPTLDPEDLEYTRAVIEPHLDSELERTAIECLFGDAAAKTLGFTPRGLSPWAGIALALEDARRALVLTGGGGLADLKP
jgi:hypothetical protein